MPDPFDIVLRTVAVMSALFLSVTMFAAARGRAFALPGALFAAAVASFVVSSSPNSQAQLGAWIYPLTAVCVTKAVWFWLFARGLFRDSADLRLRHVLIVVAISLAGTWQQLVFLERYRSGVATPAELLPGFGFDVLLLVFVLLAVGEAARDLAADLVERRRRLRLAFIAVTGAYLAIALVIQSWNLLFETRTPPLVSTANLALIAFASLGAAALLLQVSRENWLKPAADPVVPALNEQEESVLTRLEHAFEVERLYLEDGLTIGALATKLGTSERTLRRVINRHLNYRNFNDFLHAWRIREACEELGRPEQARIPVLSIAMKVGYGSIGAFNRAFKARVGMTPSDFRRRQAEGTSAGR